MNQDLTTKKQNLKTFLEEELSELKAKNLYRETINHLKYNPKMINFSSNDYLGLGSKIINASDFYHDPDIQKAILGGKLDIFSGEVILDDHFSQVSLFQQDPEPTPSINTMQYGSTGSRLTTGTHEIHEQIEKFLTLWKQTESSMVFGSGYLANVGTLSALLTPRDVVFTDEYNHSCIFDGIRLSGAKKFIYKHNDMQHLEELLTKHRDTFAKALIVTDTVFSMDGDRAKLTEICKLRNKFTCATYVDEAHATGVLGPSGAGLVEELVNQGEINYSDIDIQMGTFSKAIGLEGAYVAGSGDLINFLKNKARTFVYSTASSPIILNRVLENLKIIREDNILRNKLKHNILFFQNCLKNRSNLKWTNEDTAIFSLELGDINQTLEASQKLKDKGLLVLAIRPPTVPTPRIRVCISARHSEEEISKLIQALEDMI